MANRKRARSIRIVGKTAFIPLTQGYEAIIDAADAPLVAEWNWSACIDRNTVYARRTVKDKEGVQHSVFLHNAIHPSPAGLLTDHIDGDGLNNRRSNLRTATREQNGHNAQLSARNTSGIKGVSWCQRSRKWLARITVNGTIKYLGVYSDKDHAAAAYAKASASLHGEFGRVA